MGEKTPTPKISALLRKRPVLVRANFVLTKDRKRPYYGLFCGKIHRRGLVVKRPGVLGKVQMLNLVLGVGVFSLLPTFILISLPTKNAQKKVWIAKFECSLLLQYSNSVQQLSGKR